MADGTLWLLTDQQTTHAAYVMWLRRNMVKPRRVRHVEVGLLPTPGAMTRALGQVVLQGFDRALDRILLLQDSEDGFPSGPAGQTMQEARRRLARRFVVAEDRVQAYLVPPTTEGWYLLLASVDPTLMEKLVGEEGVARSVLAGLVTQRLQHAQGSGGAPRKEDVALALGSNRCRRKARLCDVVTRHLESGAVPSEVEALPPCLRGVARWLAGWT